MTSPRRVALLIESSRAYGRECLLGVARYARTHGPWEVLHLERGLDEGIPAQVRAWEPSGLLTRIDSPSLAKAVDALNLPAVDLRGAHRPTLGAMLDSDHRAVARVAFDHFREMGYRHFAYCGYPGVDFSDIRGAAYSQLVADYGYDVSVFAPRKRQTSEEVTRRESLGELEAPGLADWLRTLPVPTAVFACNDMRGRQVLRACSEIGVGVPDDIAVVGVDNDEVICELSIPPLSSVEPDAERIGFEAAALLDRLLHGETPPTETVLVPPRGLHRRLSSEGSAIDDPTISAAIRLIRDRACQPLQLIELVNTLGVSRSTLERRFRDLLGRSPAAQIEMVRMRKAQLLLLETDYKLSRVASLTGYQSASQFVNAFKRSFGVTPGVYREGGRKV